MAHWRGRPRKNLLPPVGEGGFAKRSRVRASLGGYRPLIRRGLRPRHLLPQGEKERSPRFPDSTPATIVAAASREIRYTAPITTSHTGARACTTGFRRNRFATMFPTSSGRRGSISRP